MSTVLIIAAVLAGIFAGVLSIRVDPGPRGSLFFLVIVFGAMFGAQYFANPMAVNLVSYLLMGMVGGRLFERFRWMARMRRNRDQDQDKQE